MLIASGILRAIETSRARTRRRTCMVCFSPASRSSWNEAPPKVDLGQFVTLVISGDYAFQKHAAALAFRIDQRKISAAAPLAVTRPADSSTI